MNAPSEIWDKKSKNYAKYNGELTEFQKDFFKVLDGFGICFKDKTIIDVGCGTGIYSLYLAKQAKEVFCVDISKLMLENLENAAKNFNISNIKTLNSTFDELKVLDKFDIAFLTMSPALKNESDFEKFISFATKRIYLNWLAPRKSSLVDKFLKNGNKCPIMTPKLESFLISKGISYKSHDFFEEREIKRNFQEAFENVIWHMQINDLEIDESKIKSKLEEIFNQEGTIIDELKTSMRVLVF